MIYEVARLTRRAADHRAAQQGMTRAQWGVVLKLARQPGITQRDLADMLDVEPITVARLIDRMETAGLVERRADAQDRRVWRLHLHPEAEALRDEVQQARDALVDAITAGLDAPTRAAMADGLKTMKANLLRLEETK